MAVDKRSSRSQKGHQPQREMGIALVMKNPYSGDNQESFSLKQMEPAKGFEPMACGLRNRCSTTELRWLV
jgi:hypothetical protein